MEIECCYFYFVKEYNIETKSIIRAILYSARSIGLQNFRILPISLNLESIFAEIFIKIKPYMLGTLHKPPHKIDFADCIDQMFSQFNALKTWERYLLGDFNRNLFFKGKSIFSNRIAKQIKRYSTFNKKIFRIVIFLFFRTNNDVQMRSTDRTATFTDLVLTIRLMKLSSWM